LYRRMQEVDLTHGRIEEMPDLTRFALMTVCYFCKNVFAFKSLILCLQTLCLRQNLLKSVATISVNVNPLTLTNLDLYDNLITDLTGIEELVNLT
jgi:hypothetical protein